MHALARFGGRLIAFSCAYANREVKSPKPRPRAEMDPACKTCLRLMRLDCRKSRHPNGLLDGFNDIVASVGVEGGNANLNAGAMTDGVDEATSPFEKKNPF
jgi:hypothetical protein